MKKLIMGFLSLIASLTGWGQSAAPESVDDPRALCIYQIMVASFQHGEGGAPGYTAMWGPDGHTKNGNLRGIINALPHIKRLGANAVWMTPIFDCSKGFGGEKLQATGYFTNNFFKIDPHFGTEADLRELIDKAHKMGLHVIFDGVFGHHGGVETPSPSGYTIYGGEEAVKNDRGEDGIGNVKYPESLDYFKEVATWWIDNYGIDGWRLDQAYQAMQGGHNYWTEITAAVDSVCAARKARGEKWGTLGYMVGEDWGTAEVINKGVYRDGGLKSAFDFDGKERISGPMQQIEGEGLAKGYADIITTLSTPTSRGYLNDEVIPNLFLTNHDGYRLSDHFDPADRHFYEKLMYRHAILAAYSGPITLYYGDEFADLSRNTKGGQKDNIARTSGHLNARNQGEARLANYISKVMRLRQVHPALWRGEASFHTVVTPAGKVLVVTKNDTATSDKVMIVFSDHNDSIPLSNGRTVKVKAYVPEFVVIK